MANEEIDGFLTSAKVAELEAITTRALRNRISAGTFPKPDAIRDGFPLWLRSSYLKYQAAVLAGDYRGRDRVAHLRGQGEVAA
jgi:predicted DNA-binding transcriptional regulator AlpA